MKWEILAKKETFNGPDVDDCHLRAIGNDKNYLHVITDRMSLFLPLKVTDVPLGS